MALLGKSEPELWICDILVLRIRIRGSVPLPLTYMDPIDLPGGGQHQPSRRPAHGPAE
jgi:hypothetical protein